MNLNEAEFMQYLNPPLSKAPSGKTWPRWLSPRLERTSVSVYACELSPFLRTLAASRCRFSFRARRNHEHRGSCQRSRHEAANVRLVGHLKTGAIPHPYQRAMIQVRLGNEGIVGNINPLGIALLHVLTVGGGSVQVGGLRHHYPVMAFLLVLSDPFDIPQM